jgi:hypothetical protein
MTREELSEATNRFLKDGGKITKLPAGPDFSFQAYSVRVPKSNRVDLTAMEDPNSKKQMEAFESGKL